MADKVKINDEEIAEDIKELSVEEKAEKWIGHVRNGLNSLLDIYLPPAESAGYNVHYTQHEIERLETGPVLDKTKADSVLISITIKFKDPVDLTKPIGTDKDKGD